LGKTTDTQDISGEVLKTGDTSALTEEQVKNCICGYIGEYDQLPPMYSALKVNGKKLYELAREGKEVERKTRKVQILDIQIKEVKLPRVRMEVSCSKGTYIRTLCHDIGEELGCGGCMEQLLRTRVSCFNLKDSLKLDEVRAYREQEKLAEILIPIDEMFSDKKAAIVMKKFEALAYNGNELKMSMIKLKEEAKATEFVEGEQIRLYDQAQHFIGIFVYHENERKFVVEKMFLDQEELKK
jgi:tRNA pseudouridine55 synthase